jgi:hypothetical protein
MRQRSIASFPLPLDQATYLPFRQAQHLRCTFGRHPTSLDLVHHVNPFQFLECQCLLLVHKVTFSLNSYWVTNSFNIYTP